MPSSKTSSGNLPWYVHLQDETLGPLTTEKIIQMLIQNRLQFADFAWRNGLTKWIRISEIDEFATHMPGYPKTAIPSSEPVRESSPQKHKSSPAPEPQVKPEQPEKPEPPKTPTRFLRVALSGKVVTTSHGAFEILNLAERGVFVGAKQPLEIGTDLQFRLEAEELGDAIQMRGVVIRHGADQGQPGFAIEFTRLNPVHKSLVEKYVRKKLGQED